MASINVFLPKVSYFHPVHVVLVKTYFNSKRVLVFLVKMSIHLDEKPSDEELEY